MMDLFGSLPPPSAPSTDKKPPPTEEANLGQSRKRSDHSPPLSNDAADSSVKKVKVDVTLSRYQLRGYHGERKGEREEMQDSHVIINNMMEQFPTLSNSPVSSVSYYGVFDGHSGSRASEFAAGNLHRVIVNKFPKEDVSAQSIKRCLVDSFKKTDSDFLSLAAKATPSWKDGSTVAIIMAIDNVLYSGNLGDSKSVIYRRSGKGDTGGEPTVVSVPLTKDHTSASLEERKRIEKSGGFVREGRIMGIMEVSRSIGDGRFKGCGLVATPHVSRCELTENDLFVVVACDGLWNVFKMDEVAKFILGVVNDESIQKPGEDDRLIQGTEVIGDREYRFEVACNRLAVEAVKRGCTDNVTVLIVDIIKNNNH
ncbi:PREDICTED: integrin-linked kinase-associated serine/threonine phosphatase 2C-like isoform X1 [Amphimedon queenslandica]|uniref:PPM-type phosphatase domain-containing protein n=2 Tax=Amphimedon queenslandica TaxID=400682 RepID=A0A1X7VMS6_AMPQE|nr:PREDICTED: integrin-linked kinase-associated serine/threonine phosphatase 2C-like isoform X1 [Amphimedon queenslandica]|eukprot:XP_019861765.1 PREDICTED: integrin-linked kinase-associated serine/threonine phosphatase 2C-like isoform X1 [Amphimedon queenslandica]